LQIDTGTSNSNNGVIPTNFPVDTSIFSFNSGLTGVFNDRLRGYGLTNSGGVTPMLSSNAAAPESDYAGSNPFFYNARSESITRGSNGHNTGGVLTYFLRRAPGFFDEVCYTSTGSGVTLNHNLGVAPEMVIFKCRSTNGTDWLTYLSSDATKALQLNSSAGLFSEGAFNNTAFTSTTMSLLTDSNVNSNAGRTYVAYLFASCPGVSKIGTYTGTGTTLQVNCGFTAGARLVLIKREDSTGGWFIWDTARGIISGDDPYYLLNSTAAQVSNTDYIDPYSAGFELSSSAPAALNASGGTYLFLAIA
jgi:hypothetical protein